jgi:hypothetical protein
MEKNNKRKANLCFVSKKKMGTHLLESGMIGVFIEVLSITLDWTKR